MVYRSNHLQPIMCSYRFGAKTRTSVQKANMDWPMERERLLQTISRQQEDAERLAKRFKKLQKTLVEQQKLLDRYQRALIASGCMSTELASNTPTPEERAVIASLPASVPLKHNSKPRDETDRTKRHDVEPVRGLKCSQRSLQPPVVAKPMMTHRTHESDSEEAVEASIAIKNESIIHKIHARKHDPAWISTRKAPDFIKEPPSSPTETDSTTLKRKRPTTASTWAQEKERMRVAGIAALRPNTALSDAKPKPSSSREKNKKQEENKENAYQYVEVVRNREARAALSGHDCVECRKYYEALGGLGDAALQKSKCSRHRARFVPYDTPDGFWNLSFPDSL